MNKDSIILIAEHNEEHFDMTRNALLRAGVGNQILHFVDGRQMLDYLFETHSQPTGERPGREYVLFMDLNLPDADGLDVLAKIKQDERLGKIPVIVLTAVDDRHTIDQCYNLGCGTYMVKPAEDEDFKESIQNIGSFLSVVETTAIG